MKRIKFKQFLSLKNKLIIYFMVIALVPSSIITIYYYIHSNNLLSENIGESNYRTVSNIMSNIEKQVKQVDNFTEWVYVNRDIIELLRRNSEVNVYDETKKRAIVSMEEQFNYLPITEYIDSLFILGRNGLILRNGPDANLIDVNYFSKEWYECAEHGYGQTVWGNTTQNYTELSKDKDVIPLFKVIKDIERGNELGTFVLLFSEKIFSEVYKGLPNEQGEQIFLVDDKGNILSSNDNSVLGTNISDSEFYINIMRKGGRYFECDIQNRKSLVVYKKSDKTNWMTVQILPTSYLEVQKRDIQKTVIWFIVGTISLSLLFSLFLSWNFTKPIHKLVVQVKQIASGNFNQSIKLKRNDEIGILAKSIQKMALDIQNLINESLRIEEEKRKIEIKVLQNQINPHFLYNTLNSIKWMATLQRADGIRQMVSSLGKLLTASVSDINEKISIQEELNILENYIHIQKIRYKGKVEFDIRIKDDRYLRYSILKFTLQPLVENAIFHGIEPKEGTGKIILSIIEDDNHLILNIWDNGIGISEGKINKILKHEEGHKSSRGFRGIGLENVNQRIKLMYGEQYGINVESEQGKYTQVSVHLPTELYKVK